MSASTHTPAPKVFITTLGCKVNQFESASFASGFEQAGCRLVDNAALADIIVVNTCAVTARAGGQSRREIRKQLRLQNGRPRKIVVTGCYAQTAADEIRRISAAPLVIGNSDKEKLVEAALDEATPNNAPLVRDVFNLQTIAPLVVDRFPGRTRAFLKVQDGCNNFCSYCIVPHARGRSRSLPLDTILEQIKRFSDNGYRELVITGIHAGIYGRDLAPPTTFDALVDTVSNRFPEIRFRLSSLEPSEISDLLIRLIHDRDNLMPHFHIPLQSGDDTVLSRMRRRYLRADFAAITTKIISALPFAGIGVDVMVGFPGEDATAFENTSALLQELPVAFFHVFPFSPRPGTPAAAMPDQVAGPVKEERASLLRELGREKRRAFFQKNTNRIVQVLLERNSDGQKVRGFSDNYLPVTVDAGRIQHADRPHAVRLQSFSDDTMYGTIISHER